MLVDPFGNRVIAGNSPMDSQRRVSFLVEVAIPESASRRYGVQWRPRVGLLYAQLLRSGEGAGRPVLFHRRADRTAAGTARRLRVLAGQRHRALVAGNLVRQPAGVPRPREDRPACERKLFGRSSTAALWRARCRRSPGGDPPQRRPASRRPRSPPPPRLSPPCGGNEQLRSSKARRKRLEPRQGWRAARFPPSPGAMRTDWSGFLGLWNLQPGRGIVGQVQFPGGLPMATAAEPGKSPEVEKPVEPGKDAESRAPASDFSRQAPQRRRPVRRVRANSFRSACASSTRRIACPTAMHGLRMRLRPGEYRGGRSAPLAAPRRFSWIAKAGAT